MGDRQRPPLKGPVWIIALISLVSLLLVFAYIYPPQSSSACYLFSSNGCKALSDWLPPVSTRDLSDEEIASKVVIRSILDSPAVHSENPKIAFMFLTPGSLPFEKLWEKFFEVIIRDFNISSFCAYLILYHLVLFCFFII